MSSGVQLKKNGAVIGTGANLDVRTIGFRPRSVRIFNLGAGLASGEWFDSMPDGSVIKRVTAGTMSLVTGGNGVTPLADGFRIGADANLNVAGQTIHWEAHE